MQVNAFCCFANLCLCVRACLRACTHTYVFIKITYSETANSLILHVSNVILMLWEKGFLFVTF